MSLEQADLVIVGAGTAGIPAALFAARRGGRIVLLESGDRVGGTLHVSSGHMSAAGAELQRARGIADTPADHFADVMRISRGSANPLLLKVATDHAADTIDWLMANGFDMGPECPVIAYSHEPYKVPRTYWGRDGGRSILAVLKPLIEAAVAAGKVDLRFNARVTALTRDGGRWIVACGDRRIATGNVVLATGGYAANPALFTRVTGGLPLLSPAPAGADGSGLEIAEGLGGRLQNQGIFLPTVGGVPDEPGGHQVDWARKAILTPQHRPPWEIYVNLRGERFVAEDDPSPDSRERALKQQPELAFWIVYDERIRREAPPLFPARSAEEMAKSFETHPAFRKADSLEGLARICGFDAKVFRSTIEAYNSGSDGLDRRSRPAPIGEAPFYAIRHQGVTLRCWAGIEIDDQLRVIGADGPIPGLYAVGEIIGGAALSGDSFASGMSVTPALTFGRLLGEKILQW